MAVTFLSRSCVKIFMDALSEVWMEMKKFLSRKCTKDFDMSLNSQSTIKLYEYFIGHNVQGSTTLAARLYFVLAPLPDKMISYVCQLDYMRKTFITRLAEIPQGAGWSQYPIKVIKISLLLVFSCDQAALWMVFSVRLSVCHTFLTMFPSSYHHEIFRSYHIGPG